MAVQDDFNVKVAAVSAFFLLFDSSDDEQTVTGTSSQGHRRYRPKRYWIHDIIKQREVCSVFGLSVFSALNGFD